ncbi:carbohydrate-binding module family 12 protein [Piromyces sp. E2]|nr:carbohydrate-binding module family 12 protein [Piromyces sp. E2]|eukprot:OUM63918.1 carbohydrate-binding module family 12 protein [Piromyces sp. E2]
MGEQWRANVSYGPAGTKVEYQGILYELIQPHTSQIGWEPGMVPALWRVCRDQSGVSKHHRRRSSCSTCSSCSCCSCDSHKKPQNKPQQNQNQNQNQYQQNQNQNQNQQNQNQQNQNQNQQNQQNPPPPYTLPQPNQQQNQSPDQKQNQQQNQTQQPPFGQGPPSFGQGPPPFGQGPPPFGHPPFGGFGGYGQPPYDGGQYPPYGQDPYGGSQYGGGSQFGDSQYIGSQYGGSQYGGSQYGSGGDQYSQYGGNQYGGSQYPPFPQPFGGQQYMVNNQSSYNVPYQWVRWAGYTPENAVTLSNKLGKTFIVARGPVEGGVHPGYADPNNNKCFVSYGGKEIILDDFEVLVCDSSRYMWMPCSDKSSIGNNAVVGGYEYDGLELYVCKCMHKGVPYFGKTSTRANCAYFAFDSKERTADDYDILTYH